MISYSRFPKRKMQTHPFSWIQIPSFFETSQAQALELAFPHDQLVQADSAQKHYRLKDLTLIERGSISDNVSSLPVIWSELAQDLLHPNYRQWTEELTGIDLSQSKLKVRFCAYEAGCWMLPHTDQASRLVTQIVYLTSKWSPEMGGGLAIYEYEKQDPPWRIINAAFNSSVLFVRSNNSYHAVEPVAENVTRSRCSLLIQHVDYGMGA